MTIATLAILAVLLQHEEPWIAVPLLENGDFALPEEGADELSVPWWIATPDGVRVERDAEGRAELVTSGAGRAWQPITLHAPLASRLVVRGRASGEGRVRLRDGAGAAFELGLPPSSEPCVFEIRGAQVERLLGRALVPRLELELAGDARWSALEAHVALPLPAEDELAAEIRGLLEPILATWLERATDDVGPRATSFACASFDVVTGERLDVGPAGVHPLYEQLARALEVAPRPAWEAALDAFVLDLLELGLHPDTGLPRRYDPVRDAPVEGEMLEVARTLRFLLDRAESGEGPLAERCLGAARRLAQGVLRHGVLPTGEVAALYRAEDAAASHAVPHLRKLDVAAQLVRLGGIERDEALRQVGLRALARLEYAHAWTGDARGIDPGFNDFYGNLGARSITMWRAWPDDPVFPRLAIGGFEYYAPLWERVLRHGRGASPDQVRAWEVAIDLAALQPKRRERVSALLDVAVRAHLKGQQYDGGAFGGVAFYRHAPNVDVESGDVRGLPMNLLQGIARCHASGLGPPREATRALFTAVMRATRDHYRRPFGYLLTPDQRPGRNPAGGGLVFAIGLIEMLGSLEAR